MLTVAALLTSTATPSTPAVSNVLINPSLIGSKNILITTNMASQNSGGDSLKRKHEDDDDYDAVWRGNKLLPHPAVSRNWCRSRPVRTCGASFFLTGATLPRNLNHQLTEAKTELKIWSEEKTLCCFCFKEHSTKMNKNLVCLDNHLQVMTSLSCVVTTGHRLRDPFVIHCMTTLCHASRSRNIFHVLNGECLRLSTCTDDFVH